MNAAGIAGVSITSHQPSRPARTIVMTTIHRRRPPGVSPAQAGQSRQRLLTRGAALASLAAASTLVAACGSSGGNTASSGASSKKAPTAVVSARQLSGVGVVLVTRSGMTIYTPKMPAEVNGNIKCTGSCLSFWFPVTTSSASLRSSGLPGKLGTIHLSDGKTQLTYSGRPLYTFRLDTAAGQAHGNNYSDSFNGIKFTWQIVTPSGKAAGAGSPAPTPSYSTQGGY
jgi:predicted lipoprotein with Yx(FWY)xxD motif